jgi:hypothetical protein
MYSITTQSDIRAYLGGRRLLIKSVKLALHILTNIRQIGGLNARKVYMNFGVRRCNMTMALGC